MPARCGEGHRPSLCRDAGAAQLRAARRRIVIAVRDLAELTASRGSPSDFPITIVVGGVEYDEYRFGDLFADGEPYDGEPNLRRVGPAIGLTGDVGEVHDVKILHPRPL